MKLSEFKEKVIKLKGQEVWDYIVGTEAYKIYTAPEEEQLKAVQQDEYNIIYIDNPSEEMKLEALKNSGNIIQYINNPTEEMQLKAVKSNGYAIQYINNPTEEMKLVAVKQKGYAIEYIDNPSEEIQLIAVKQDSTNIVDINNPTDKVIQELIEKIDIDNTCNFKYILRFLENDLKEEREEQTIKLSELKNMTLEQIKELLNKSIEEETNE